MTTTATRRDKATHSGHCQACGNLQKLPKGALSKHGYNIAHGFFSGVCVGAGSLPFEQSHDLVDGFILSAKRELTRVETFQANLRQPATEASAWILCYKANPKGGGFSRDRRWEKVAISEEIKPFHDGSGSYSKFSHTANTKWQRVKSDKPYPVSEIQTEQAEVHAEYGATILEVATKHNSDYANWLEHQAVSMRRYIAWQEERVRTWQPAPLLPVDAKDKEGFEPTEPAY